MPPDAVAPAPRLQSVPGIAAEETHPTAAAVRVLPSADPPALATGLFFRLHPQRCPPLRLPRLTRGPPHGCQTLRATKVTPADQLPSHKPQTESAVGSGGFSGVNLPTEFSERVALSATSGLVSPGV